MGPRSGKTTSLGIPYVLSAPGPVVATSVRADLWAATAELRAASGSGVWVFDPQHTTAAGQRFWVNLLAGMASVEAAHRLAGHFVLTVDDSTKRDIWGPAAQELLTSLLLAAASSRRTLLEVSRWLDDPGTPTPAELLDDAGYRALASSLRGAQHGAPETRDGIYQTARTAAKCLHDPEIMAWVTPPRNGRLPAFDPLRFALSSDVLYLITESRSAASPLIAGLTDAAMRAGRRRAEQAGGRLDPPMVLVLDEAANICRIADLPDLYSHLGGRGMIPVTILQSYEQGITVWGEQGMAALWGSATKKLIGAGVDSPRLTRDVATLIGHHDVPVRSISIGDGRASEQISYQRRLIMEAADIRSIERGTALLLASGIRPALIGLRPWNARPDAPRIDAARLRAEAAIQRAAQAVPGSPPVSPGGRAGPAGHPAGKRHDSRPGAARARRGHRRAARAGVPQRRALGHLAFPAHVPAPARRRVPLVPAMVAARRGHHPAHRPVAVLGSHAAPARHRDRQLAPRPPGPPAAHPARPQRPFRPVLPRRARRAAHRRGRPAAPRLVGDRR